MTWPTVMMRIEKLVLHTSPYSLVLVVLLASLLGGGLRALLTPLMPFLHESRPLRFETPKPSGPFGATGNDSANMKNDSARWSGNMNSTPERR